MTEGMNVKDYDYDLPEELIAQDPLEDRSSSRLMVLDQTGGQGHRRERHRDAVGLFWNIFTRVIVW